VGGGGVVTAIRLPAPYPHLPDEPAELLDWATRATRHHIVATRRAGRHEHAGLTVTLEHDAELFFETIAEANRPERFVSAFMAIDGVVMPNYTGPQVKEIVGALIRAARIGHERDERETFTDLGQHYLRGCLEEAGVIGHNMRTPAEQYGAAILLRLETRHLRGEEHERWPRVLHAPDLQAMFVLRGLFLAYSRRIVGRMNTAALNEHMRRVGWADVELHPRKPRHPDAARPHLHTWRIPNG
jgi:hypothetical protein